MQAEIDLNALFSDSTEDYFSPSEPNPYSQVTIRFRTARQNIDHIYVVNSRVRHHMLLEQTEGDFDYFYCIMEVEDEEFSYYFEIHTEQNCYFYDTRGVVEQAIPEYAFRVIPGFKTPKWAKGAVMYQIYVDRFYNGDPSNDVLTGEYEYVGDKTIHIDDWNKVPAVLGVREFYGGDLQGVLDKMDYLEGLGIDVIYFNPLFVSPSNHKYDIQDYDNIDPHFGKLYLMKGSFFPLSNMKIVMLPDI